MTEKLAYTIDDVVTLTTISRSGIERAIHAGDLAAKKQGRRYLITRKAVEDFLTSLPDVT